MNVRTFQARQMRDALALVRREMGADAVILTTRKLRRGLGLLGSAGIEVTAATVETRGPAVSAASGAAVDPDTGRQLGTLRKEIRVLREQLRETSDLAANLCAQLPTPGAEWRRQLEEADVDPALSSEIVRAALAAVASAETSADTVHAALSTEVVRRLATAAPPGYPGSTAPLVALVGPTGVGKTTTLAKIAARAALERGLRVALVTLDTYRIGAVAQLGRYAEIVGVPLEVARDAAALEQACRRHAQADLVLIDTAGRADEQTAIDHLGGCLQAAPGVQVNLCIPAATRRSDLRAILRRYAPLGPTRLIITKVDETAELGGLLNAVVWSGLPLCCVTVGQRVPEDLEPALAAAIGARILYREAN
jgi:flagellar biosynthesis protein FlhF